MKKTGARENGAGAWTACREEDAYRTEPVRGKPARRKMHTERSGRVDSLLGSGNAHRPAPKQRPSHMAPGRSSGERGAGRANGRHAQQNLRKRAPEKKRAGAWTTCREDFPQMHADTLLLHRGAKTSVYTPYVRILRSRFATKRQPSHMKPPRDSSANVNACA